MAKALLLPVARLDHHHHHLHHSLPHDDPQIVDDTRSYTRHSHSTFASEYDYLRQLIGRRGSNPAKHSQQVFCGAMPTLATVGTGYGNLDPNIIDSADDTPVAPGSPPALSYSKSSKSSTTSSLRSTDTLSDDDSSTERLANFEDVALDDARREGVEDCNVKPESRPTLRRPSRRSGLPIYPGGHEHVRRSHSAAGPDAHHFPSLRTQVNGALKDTTLNLPTGRARTRTSPTSPAGLMMRPSSRSVPSRSPSPGDPAGMANSLRPAASPSMTSRDSWETRSANSSVTAFSHQRQQSWQPGRKTVKEREAECNDEDEDVPEEAILENVPISPMPGQPASFSPRSVRSNTPSPNRRIPSHGSLNSAHGNLHSANVPKNAKRPSASMGMRTGQYGSPRSPHHGHNGKPPMLPRSATVASFPPEPFSNKHRSKSWSDDLNDEARHLSQALEELAVVSSARSSVEKRHSGGGSSIYTNSPRPSLNKMRAKTTVTELPPVQKGNIMIDPLPISKEKEAVLTRTRPSWLPPKNQREEKKHVREWEQMMARAAESEKKRASRQKEEMENKEEMQDSIARIWEQHVLPKWDEVINEPRTRELWWRGVTPSNRAAVWQRAIGNELELSPASFEAALRRAGELEERVAEMPDEERSHSTEAAWLDAIARDIPHVLPELPVYQFDGHLHQSLTDVLKAYAMYRRDVGYVYGTHLVAGMLCLQLPAADAFVMLANLLNRPLPLAFLVHDQTAMARAYDLVLTTLKYKFPTLHSHLTTHIQPDEILDPLFRCLFAYNLPPTHVGRLLDLYVFEGDKLLIRAAVAVLGRLEGRLYGSRQEILDVVSWRCEKRWDGIGGEEEFIAAVRDAGKVEGRREG